MEFTTETKLDKRKEADAIVVPFWEHKSKAQHASKAEKLKSEIELPLQATDFQGKRGEVLFLYAQNEPETRILLLGLGKQDNCSIEYLRRAYGSLSRACSKKKVKSLNLILPNCKNMKEEAVLRGVAEGLILSSYSFQKLFGQLEPEKKFQPIEKVALIGNTDKKGVEFANQLFLISKGVFLARDLVNDNADTVTPQYFSDLARSLEKKYKQVKATVWDKQRIIKEKMGLLLAVSRGSDCDPALIVMEYKGGSKSKEHTVVVGKGVTYDTGGLNLKPTGYMETMREDMAGAAVCFGLIEAAASMGLKANFTVVIPSTENSIGSKSYKPGDVYPSYSGKTVEIGNTDAEGRLILADALSYTVRHLKPTCIIDFATLTGAIDIALGDEATGMMSNNDELAHQLSAAGDSTFERLWRMPLFEEYREQLKSDIADIKNVGGRSGGSCTAAMFLREFVEDVPWAHCDIASTAFLKKEKDYLPKYGTGVGVRLMIEFLLQTKSEINS